MKLSSTMSSPEYRPPFYPGAPSSSEGFVFQQAEDDHGLPTISIETITPAEAEEYLARNKNVRKLRPSAVARYAQDILDGRWYIGTSVISFDSDGNLVGGQHRMHACAKAKVPFTTIVARDVSQGAIDNDDQGLKRTIADVLRSHGEANVTALQASVAMSWRWDQGNVMASIAPTASQSLEYLDANPDLRASVTMGHPLCANPLNARISAVGPFIYRIRQIDAEAAEEFIKRLHTGIDLSDKDPVLRLRQQFLNRRSSAYGKPSRHMELALLVKTWNPWIAGKALGSLKWRRTGERPEDFPMLSDSFGHPYPFPELAQFQAAAAAASVADEFE